MIQPLTLHLPRIIEFGNGKIQSLKEHLKQSHKVYLLVDPLILSPIEPLLKEIESEGKELLVSSKMAPEPPFEVLEELLVPVYQFNPDTVVGIGGGSTLDLAKLISVLFDGQQKAMEVVGIGKVITRKVKLITAATTAGTGSEVTPIAVMTDTKEKLKKGVVSPHLVPDVAIVDPELTVSLPAPVTAATGVDAMTHCIEAFTNKHAHPIIDMIALEGIRLISANLERAVTNGKDIEARTALSLGSLYGGMCLGPVNTAAVHAMAYPLGGEFKVSHGVSNSVLLPFVMEFNLPACTEKYARVAEAMGIPKQGTDKEMARNAIHRVRAISQKIGIPSNLRELNIPASAIPLMAEGAMKVTRLMNNNPRALTLQEVEQIYRNSYEGKLS
ncbi:MAG: iron-containing alcohol dehydrogenase [Spirochaetales bacterium]